MRVSGRGNEEVVIAYGRGRIPRRSNCRPLLRLQRPQTVGGRLLVVAGSIALALVIDAVTGGRWRWVVGSTTILTSLLALMPGLSWLVPPIGAYVGVWLSFNMLRARADGTAWASEIPSLVPRLEARLFAGRLPSSILQEHFYDPRSLAWYDYGWTAVYLSFFVAPHLVALLLLWGNRELFWRYLLAMGALFALALVGFFAIPTAPPWLIAQAVPEAGFAQVRRVTEEVLGSFDLPVRLYNRGQVGEAHASEVRFEPNPIAAMPSIHFAATALLAFPAARTGRLRARVSILYAGLMGVALVYLGEHYVLDLVAGGVLAVFGWTIAGRVPGCRLQEPQSTGAPGRLNDCEEVGPCGSQGCGGWRRASWRSARSRSSSPMT